MNDTDQTLLNQKDLAAALGITRWRFEKMRKNGFPMPCGLNTPAAARQWLQDNAALLTKTRSARKRRTL